MAATRLLTAAAQPVEIGDLSLQVSASLGVAFFPQTDEVDADQLLRQADQSGKLRVPDPLSAADQFFCLIKGGANFRLLIGCGEALQGAEAEAHVRDAVEVFLRAFRAD